MLYLYITFRDMLKSLPLSDGNKTPILRNIHPDPGKKALFLKYNKLS